MAYTITSQKIVSIITDSVGDDGLPVWHAEETTTGDKSEVIVTLDTGETIQIYVDSIDASQVASEVESLIEAE